MRRAVMTAAVLACVLGLAACNDDAAGTGSPTTGQRQAGKPYTGNDPCTLLKPADLPELNQDSQIQPTALNGFTCAGDDFMVQISDGVDGGLGDMRATGPGVKPIPDVGGYKAALRQTTITGHTNCGVVLQVTETQLVQVFVTKSDPKLACDTANKAAAVVAGRLPK
jgi:hypothetical protein